MSSISYSVGLDTSKFQGAIGIMRKGIGGIGSLMGGLSKALPVGALIGGIGGVTGALALLKKSSNLAADFESTSLAMGTLIGNAEKTKVVLEQIENLASSTPFEFPELASSGKMLLAFGESADTVADTLRRIGDVSAGIQAPITEIAELYGKARTQGTLFAEDINQMTGRGIPMSQELAKVLGVSADRIKKMASEGSLTFPLLQQAFINLSSEGGKFFGMMDTQSKSTNGLISTLTDGWNKLLRTVGTPLNDWLRPQISGWIKRIDSAGVRLSAFINLLKQAQSSGKLGEFLGAGLNVAIIKGVNIFSSGIRGSVAFLAATLPGIITSARNLFVDSGFVFVLQGVFDTVIAKFKAGLLNAAAAINFSGVSDEDAARADRTAGAQAYILKKELASLDFGAGLKSAASEVKAALEKGTAAYKDASKEKLIDETKAVQNWSNLAKSLDFTSWKEFVDGQKSGEANAAKTVTQAEGLADALKKAGENADKAGTKIKENNDAENAGGMVPAAVRERRKIFKKDEGDTRRFSTKVGGLNGDLKFGFRTPQNFAEKAQAIQNAGRNTFGQNRPPREAKDKAPTIDPLTRIWTEIKETNRRLGELGLA
jgi:tape measure domain-containing protein